jgi:hypothetical protein
LTPPCGNKLGHAHGDETLDVRNRVQSDLFILGYSDIRVRVEFEMLAPKIAIVLD